jgi:MoaA/NifB/PqqE/SkfB family radical SAM enzyme
MCDSWKKPAGHELGVSDISRIFDQLPQMDVVRLTGGEPFLRRDLTAIAHLAQEKLRPAVLHITTNGFLTDRILQFCERRRKDIPLHILVSVDGLGEKHNRIRGRKTAWEDVVTTLRALALRRKEFRIRIAVNQTVVDAEGAEHYRQLRAFLRPLQIRNHLVMAYDVSGTYSLEAEVDAAPTEVGQFVTRGQFTRNQIEELLDEAEGDLASYSVLQRMGKKYYLRGLRNRLLNGTGDPNPKCVALTCHLRLMPDGSVPTCQFNTVSVGNLQEQPFEDVWLGHQANRQRAWVQRCPGCWAECEVLPSAIYTGDLIRKGLFSRAPHPRLFGMSNNPLPARTSL